MNLKYIIEQVESKRFKRKKFIYKGIRNQKEKFIGIIKKCYPNIFIVELVNGRIKSFSYNDIIMGNLVILS